MNNRKQYSIEYPLKVIEISDFKRNPVYILEQCGLNLKEINKYNVLMFIDSYDYKKYFNDMRMELLVLNRLMNVDSYEGANRLYKLFLNSKVWLIHGFVENGTSFYKSDNDEGNFLLLLNTTDLFVKNQILDGLKRLLDSFLTSKKFLFEIYFDEILKSCLKRKMEIQYLHKTTTSKFKCIKSNILFTTINLYSNEANLLIEKQNCNNETRLGSFMKRFRNAFSPKMTASNIVTSKFSLNQLPYLSFQQENRNTFTFSVNNEEKFFKMYKNTNIVYQRYIQQDNRNQILNTPFQESTTLQPHQKAYSESSLLISEPAVGSSPSQQIYVNELNQNYYYNEFDQLEVDVDDTVAAPAINNIYYNTPNEIEEEVAAAPPPAAEAEIIKQIDASTSTKDSSFFSTSSSSLIDNNSNRIVLQKAKSVDQLSVNKNRGASSGGRDFSYFENKCEEHIYEDDNLIISEEEDEVCDNRSIQRLVLPKQQQQSRSFGSMRHLNNTIDSRQETTEQPQRQLPSTSTSKSCSLGSIRNMNVQPQNPHCIRKLSIITQPTSNNNSYFFYTPPKRQESYIVRARILLKPASSMKNINQRQQQQRIFRL